LRLASPFVSGVYAGDPAQVSLAAAFPRLKRMEVEHGSLLRGMRRLGSPRGATAPRLTSFASGMGEIISALTRELSPQIIRARARAIEPAAGARLSVRTEDGTAHPADAVVLATPAFVTATLVSGPASIALAGIPYAAVDVACLGYPRSDVEHPLNGFGFLVADGEDLPILGCLWESSLFPERAPSGHVLFRVMLGGARNPDVAGLPELEVLTLARRALARTVGARAEPTLARLVRHARGIPQYTIGHRARVAAAQTAEQTTPGLFLTGNALRGVGYNDCVREAYSLAARVAAHLGGR
jgi:oxygen-dependent protoporphyrinogen oxidase